MTSEMFASNFLPKVLKLCAICKNLEQKLSRNGSVCYIMRLPRWHKNNNLVSIGHRAKIKNRIELSNNYLVAFLGLLSSKWNRLIKTVPLKSGYKI